MEHHWTTDPATGRLNSSGVFNAVVEHVESIIQNSAHDLIAGRYQLVAGMIVAHLAHEWEMAPTLERAVLGPKMRGNAEIAPEHVLIATLERVLVAFRGHNYGVRDVDALEGVIKKVREAVLGATAEGHAKIVKTEFARLHSKLAAFEHTIETLESMFNVKRPPGDVGQAVTSVIVQLREAHRVSYENGQELAQRVASAENKVDGHALVDRHLASLQARARNYARVGRHECGVCHATDCVPEEFGAPLTCGHELDDLVWVRTSETERLVSG